MKVYNKPLYYEIAFDFVDIKKQAKLFEAFIKRYSKISVKRIMDIGSGTSKQVRELAKQGYETVALDLSQEMLKFLKQEAKKEEVEVETVNANFIDFKLAKKVDFACMLMGTITYMSSNEDFLKHLNSIAGSLNKGGLYLLENLKLDWSSKKFFKPQSWTMKRDKIKVKTTYTIKLNDTLEQLFDEELKLEVNDNGYKAVIASTFTSKMIFPQELLELVNANGQFEFIGWFERYTTKPLKRASGDNILLLRKK